MGQAAEQALTDRHAFVPFDKRSRTMSFAIQLLCVCRPLTIHRDNRASATARTTHDLQQGSFRRIRDGVKMVCWHIKGHLLTLQVT